jgi:hypothetical protein
MRQQNRVTNRRKKATTLFQFGRAAFFRVARVEKEFKARQ